ncbi:hypothetical protein J1N10_13645 [Carboxylicivirga sp. A043]|uniref:hypothetical protein n=1 Tax=Carboxylicivirga litoralis TaxID=2816963 RepID=UPI0021CB2EEC|nr:hypothetical protein [Carboxylicivirga sp. A043]MCU4157028.1 hypothetical protein [Carboxylicivirga sp. A043]
MNKLHSPESVQQIIESNRHDISFILGNGINRYYKNDNLSWEQLLLDLWNQHSSKDLHQKEIFSGISFTEFYDAIEIQNFRKSNFSSHIQKEVKEKLLPWQPNSRQNLIIDRIRGLKAPILTTNFDDLIPKSAGLKFFKAYSKSFTDYYPWNCYYSDDKLNHPADGFGVWYPNGMLKYHRSIKLGLSQYMGNVERARKMIHGNYEAIAFNDSHQRNWSGYYTWLHILFNKSIFILGLGLEENEVFIRWLLIERAKFFNRFPERRKKGWYITTRNNDDLIYIGKKFFMQSVGIEVLEVEDYDVQYDKIWHL